RGLRKRRDRARHAQRACLHARNARARRRRPSARRRGTPSPHKLCGHSRKATGPHRSARARWNRAESVAAFPPARQRPGASGREPEGIEESRPPRSRRPGNDGEHGEAGGGVVVGQNERKRKEMGGRPEKYDEKEKTRPERDAAGRPPPADEGRKGPCGTADNDV